MDNLSQDEIMKPLEDIDNLKQQATAQKSAFEQLQTIYILNESLFNFFGEIDQNFKKMMKYKNINSEMLNIFKILFEQYADVLAGLKFKISRIDNETIEQNSKLQSLVNYCRQEMTIQEAKYSLKELSKVLNQITKEEQRERKRQEELKIEKERLKENVKWRLYNDLRRSEPEIKNEWL